MINMFRSEGKRLFWIMLLLEHSLCVAKDVFPKRIRKSERACINFGKRPHLLQKRIVDGVPAKINEFPMFAALGHRIKNDKIEFKCGGSLIAEKFVLTVAHCLGTATYPVVFVRLGKIKLDDPSDDYTNSDFYVEVKNTFLPNFRYRKLLWLIL